VVAISVMVDSPRVDHAGGSVAAPVFRRVAEMALRYKGLTPKGTKPVEIAELAQAGDPAQATFEILRRAEGKRPPVQEVASGPSPRAGQIRVPDMTGWPVREAVRRSLDLGVQPEVQGTGLLARQSPAPGQVVEKGEKLTLIFEPAT
jgi:cell division protein FtsI (penicillin-binding protein 3)